ncbi:MAG: acetylornithine transaminase [Myxococcales bacterium]|nr:acetylornithine transaminase [Myxococcales bacterium]MCB9628125.1 acetylornithine transaminase [Sandaracinaceae bacterium]
MSTHEATQAELLERARAVQLGNYAPAPVVFTRGEGRRLYDRAGRAYLDLSGGVAVNSVGHAHPVLAAAIAEQAARLMHVSNLFYNDRAIELASAIVDRSAFDRVYFCNSGAEANESLLKLARRFQYEQGQGERVEIISTHRSFHGRTLGALSVTGQDKYHVGMGPLLPGVVFVPYNDVDAMRAAIGPRTAAVLLEPVQAEGGIIPAAPGYLESVRALCDAEGALLLFDEVQTGYGRLGTFMGAQRSGVVPDACSLAKGIAGGFPLGAIAVTERLAGGLPPGSHASTFGGNALACAAGLAVLRIFDEEGVLANVNREGDYLGQRLGALAAELPAVTEARGDGLLRGLVLAEGVDPGATWRAALDAGVALTLAGGNVLRFTPSLNVTRAELDEGLDIVKSVLTKAAEVAA